MAHRPPDEPSVTTQPGKSRSALNLRDLWAYRARLYSPTGRDIKVRYKPATLCSRPGSSSNVTRLFLAAIILLSCMLTIHRAFIVPIFQAPDEISHFDYAVSIYSAGRLLNVREAPSGWNVAPKTYGNDWEKITHVWTQYLCEATGYENVMVHESARISPDYGSRAYFEELDRNAPRETARESSPENNPWLLRGYPFGYYTVLALWLYLVSLFTDSLVNLFFAARLFSVLLLACNLSLAYWMCRLLGLTERRALALTAIIGFFPLTTYVSSAVQPDNLSLTLALLTFCLTLRGKPAWAGLVLGCLLVTKYHVFLWVALPVFALCAARGQWRAIARALPAIVLLGCVQLWVQYGDHLANNFHFTTHLRTGVKAALRDYYYYGGYAFGTYWATPYGWKLLPAPLKEALWAATMVALALTALRLMLGWVEIVKRRSVRFALSNPVLNAHLLYLGFMVALYAATENSFVAQGRHFYPFFVSGLWLAAEYAPSAIRHKKARTVVRFVVYATLLAGCVVLQYQSLQAIRLRYYG